MPGAVAKAPRSAPPADRRSTSVSSAPAGVPIGLPAELPAPLVQLEWAAPFAGIVRAALHALKYAGNDGWPARSARPPRGAGRRVGAGGDMVIPVPVHAERARLRGYDQAALLAEAAAEPAGAADPTPSSATARTIAQFELDRAHRAANVAGAFRLRPGIAAHAAVAGRWVILVDDVITTGATLAACGATLDGGRRPRGVGLAVARER